RLTRRGLAPSVGVVVGVMAAEAAAVVPAPLIRETVHAGTLLAAGGIGVTSVAPIRVAALAQGVLQGMAKTKLKSAAILLAAVAVCFGITSHTPSQTEPSQAGEPERVTRPLSTPPKNAGAANELLGRWWVTRTSAQGKEETQDGRTGRRGNWIITSTKIIALLG